MTDLEKNNYIKAVHEYIIENLPLSKLSDEELQSQIESITDYYFSNQFIKMEDKVSIVDQVYSSIRGFGILDSIMKDETITEVMVNGPNDIFIEKNGRLQKLNDHFQSERKLEDIIQRIVSMAGREVNQANPIVDQDFRMALV